MNRIIRVDATSQVLTMALASGCAITDASAAKLTVWRAGCWPQREAYCVTEVTSCGEQTVTRYREVWPTRISYTAMSIDPEGRAVFLLDRVWLQDQPSGRYDGTVETPCGCDHVQFQKGARLRVGAVATAFGGPCAPTPCGAPCAPTQLC